MAAAHINCSKCGLLPLPPYFPVYKSLRRINYISQKKRHEDTKNVLPLPAACCSSTHSEDLFLQLWPLAISQQFPFCVFFIVMWLTPCPFSILSQASRSLQPFFLMLDYHLYYRYDYDATCSFRRKGFSSSLWTVMFLKNEHVKPC